MKIDFTNDGYSFVYYNTVSTRISSHFITTYQLFKALD